MKNYYAKRPLTYNSKKYKVGEQLNVKTGMRNQQVLNAMLRMRKITTEAPVVEAPAAPVAEAPVLPPPSANSATIVHTGAGWYNIELKGVVLNDSKIKGKDACIIWAKENDVELLTA